MAFIMENNYIEVKSILAKNRGLLDRLAEELLEKTTLIHADIEKNIIDARYKYDWSE